MANLRLCLFIFQQDLGMLCFLMFYFNFSFFNSIHSNLAFVSKKLFSTFFQK